MEAGRGTLLIAWAVATQHYEGSWATSLASKLFPYQGNHILPSHFSISSEYLWLWDFKGLYCTDFSWRRVCCSDEILTNRSLLIRRSLKGLYLRRRSSATFNNLICDVLPRKGSTILPQVAWLIMLTFWARDKSQNWRGSPPCDLLFSSY